MRLARHLAEETGVIAPMVALSLAVLIAAAGLATDFSIWFAQKRNLQAATDAAALAAAAYAGQPSSAEAQTKAMLRANFIDPNSALSSLEVGYYCPDVSVARDQRFAQAACPALAVSGPDAVRLTTRIASRTYFLRALGTPGSRAPLQIEAVAVAAQINEAGLQAGTGVAEVSPGIANPLLQSLLGPGASLTLDAATYNGLANVNIDALSFLNALAARLDVSAGTYDELLQSTVLVSQVLAAAVDALPSSGQTADVQAAITGLTALKAQVRGSPQVNLAQLFDLGVWGATPIGSPNPPTALRAGLNTYQLAAFSLELANGASAVTIPPSALGVPGLVSLNVAATAIEPPQQASFTFGPEGLSVHTAQVRLQLMLRILGTNDTGSAVELPLYVEVGSGDARIDSIRCHGNPSQDAVVQVAARSGLLNLYVGTAPANLMTNFSQPVNPASIQPANLVSLPGVPNVLGLLTTQAKASASLSSATSQLAFYQPAADPGPPAGVIGSPPWSGSSGYEGRPARVSSGIPLSSALSSLANNLSVTVCTVKLLSACILQVNLSGAGLGTIFSVLSGLDGVLQQLLAALGADIGYMDTQVTGVRCGQPVLVY